MIHPTQYFPPLRNRLVVHGAHRGMGELGWVVPLPHCKSKIRSSAQTVWRNVAQELISGCHSLSSYSLIPKLHLSLKGKAHTA